MYRLYYWLKNVPEDRPGGPWWYRDFRTKDERLTCFNDIVHMLHDYEFTDKNLPDHNHYDIKPPRTT